MASGYPGRDLRGSFGFTTTAGSSVYASYQPLTGGGGGGVLKRSVSELEREQQTLLFRSVKKRTDASLSSSSGFNFRNPCPAVAPPVSLVVESDKKSSVLNHQLQELERQLLLDDDDDDAVSATGSAVTTSEWSEAIDQLLSPPPPAPTLTIHNALSPSPSPSTSTSSSTSSTASCSPNHSTSRQLLLETAAAIADGNFETASSNLASLKRAANIRGDPDQRLTAMMLSALVARATGSAAAAHPFAELCSLEHQTATQMMYDISPCFKLGLMAANLAILDATRESPSIHVVDFDIGQGGQYAALIHAVAERSRQIPSLPPPSLKITAVSDPTLSFTSLSLATTNNLNLIADKIAKLSDRLGLDVRFNIVNRRTSELDATVLGCEQGEALAVNFSFALSKIADESVSPANPRDELLRRVRSLGPKVVTVVEQEVNFNTAPFPARFADACAYYGSLLDSLDAMSGRDSADRARVEACLGRKVANAVAKEGSDRLERPEVFGKWRARMGMAGLKPVAFGPAVVEPVKSRFATLRSVPGFTFKEEAGRLGFGWMGRVLTVASAWR
ncbi:putative scarecrow-like protein 8 [Iris pallida]|uniref:Scarecrow-like protein 8 n=1 Tax=Iris pallida TaxID=29817 RepID=A0AAX6GK14_IRIPA|nr:putative scarecrow-like protein 8 [Iris pallida]